MSTGSFLSISARIASYVFFMSMTEYSMPKCSTSSFDESMSGCCPLGSRTPYTLSLPSAATQSAATTELSFPPLTATTARAEKVLYPLHHIFSFFFGIKFFFRLTSYTASGLIFISGAEPVFKFFHSFSPVFPLKIIQTVNRSCRYVFWDSVSLRF